MFFICIYIYIYRKLWFSFMLYCRVFFVASPSLMTLMRNTFLFASTSANMDHLISRFFRYFVMYSIRCDSSRSGPGVPRTYSCPLGTPYVSMFLWRKSLGFAIWERSRIRKVTGGIVAFIIVSCFRSWFFSRPSYVLGAPTARL